MSHHLISVMIFLPVLGAILQAFLPRSPKGIARTTALALSGASGIIGIILNATMNVSLGGALGETQFSESLNWVGSYAIRYDLGLDGMSALLVLLVSIVFPILIAAEWNQSEGRRGKQGLFLILQAALLGTLCAQDIFLLFFFWALSAVPIYFLIGIWGKPEASPKNVQEREGAGFQTMVVSSIGNAFLFAAMIIIYFSVDPHSFSFQELSLGHLAGKTFEFLGHELSVAQVSFFLIGIGIALRAPIWPLHGWFTRISQNASPTVFAAVAAGVIPVANYVFFKMTYPLFPETVSAAAPVIVIIGTVNLIIGGVCALAQRNMRTLLAYVAISQVGLFLIGIGSLSSQGLVGAVYHQFALGLGVAGLALLAGIISQKTGRTDFVTEEGECPLSGSVGSAPMVAMICAVFLASLIGFPGFGGFVGHALIVVGAYSIHPLVAVLSAIAVILAVYYFFNMYRCIFLGSPTRGSSERLTDVSLLERAYLIPLVGVVLAIGIYPKPFLDIVKPTIITLLSTIK